MTDLDKEQEFMNSLIKQINDYTIKNGYDRQQHIDFLKSFKLDIISELENA